MFSLWTLCLSRCTLISAVLLSSQLHDVTCQTEHTTHFSMPKALDCIRELKPKRAFLTGMSHEFDYYKLNDELAALKESEGICVEMGYDGLALDVNL